MPDGVCVRIFPSHAEAHLAKGILEDIDIHAFLLAEDAEVPKQDDSATAGHVKLMVAPRDAARARSVLRGA